MTTTQTATAQTITFAWSGETYVFNGQPDDRVQLVDVYTVTGSPVIEVYGRRSRLAQVEIREDGAIVIFMVQVTRQGRDYASGSGMWLALDGRYAETAEQARTQWGITRADGERMLAEIEAALPQPDPEPAVNQSTRPARTDVERWDSMIERIERMVADLNKALGLDAADLHSHRVTFGYIGNCGNGFDDRSWSVFLPHPYRPGTDEDRIGSFRTGDLDGARATLNGLYGFLRGVRWANGPAMAEIQWRRAARIATD